MDGTVPGPGQNGNPGSPGVSNERASGEVGVPGEIQPEKITIPDNTVMKDYPGPNSVPVEFLSGPNDESPPGAYPVTWRFIDRPGVSNVRLRQSCCYNCEGLFSAPVEPDERGVYASEAVVPADGLLSFYNVIYEVEGAEYFGQSVYLNVPEGHSAPTDRVIWYHPRDVDPAYLQGLLAAGVITHLKIGGGDRAAHGADSEPIREALRIAAGHGIPVIWSRHLWNNWFDFPTMGDVFDPDFYAAAVEQIRLEAITLGVPFTSIDCEVYTQNPFYEFFQKDLLPEVYDRMDAAIREAGRRGKLDFVTPSGSNGRPRLHLSLYYPLGRSSIARATYYDYPEKNCKIDQPYHVFGAHVNTTTERLLNPQRPYFLPHDVIRRRYLWSPADGAPPGVDGLFLYAGSLEQRVERVADMMDRHLKGE
jgi:hypothetical protein